MSANFERTTYGFRWGALQVDRLISDRGYVVLGLEAGKHRLEVQVSPTGRSIRVFDRSIGLELRAVRGGER